MCLRGDHDANAYLRLDAPGLVALVEAARMVHVPQEQQRDMLSAALSAFDELTR